MSFSGTRLRKARLFRNWTITELSNRTGLSKQSLSQYESGIISPKSEKLFKLVTELKFPLAFFNVDDKKNNISEVDNTFFRALSSTKTIDLDTQRVKTEIITRIYSFLSEYLNLPELDLPIINFEEGLSPEQIAEKLRYYWGLGNSPIENMVALLEQRGIVVSSLKTGTNTIDAFTQVHSIDNKKLYCVVLGSDKYTMVRRNFDCAHELGHILLHSNYSDIRNLTKEEYKKMEKEANNFAAAFLLPRNSYYLDLRTPTKLESYKDLKRKWKVSIGAMVMRARHIDRITPQEYTNLMKSMSKRGWRKSEPFDDKWQTKEPILFKQAIEVLFENNVLTGSEIISELGKHSYTLNPEDVEDLLNLDVGTLSIKNEVNDNLVIDLLDRVKYS